jgi:CRP-like cAMP-binding protein
VAVADRVDALRRIPLFSELNQRQLKRIARDVRERSFEAGAEIVQQGEMSGIGFFLLVDGEAAVVVDGRQVAKLRAGDHFGELALVTEGTRTATVRALSPLRCLELKAWDFREIATENPDITWKLLQHVVGVLVEDRARASRTAAEASLGRLLAEIAP